MDNVSYRRMGFELEKGVRANSSSPIIITEYKKREGKATLRPHGSHNMYLVIKFYRGKESIMELSRHP